MKINSFKLFIFLFLMANILLKKNLIKYNYFYFQVPAFNLNK